MAQPWNLGPPVMDFTALGKLGDTYNNAFDSARKRNLDDQKRQTLANLGTQIQAGNYGGAAQSAFAAGDASTGLGILELSEKQKSRQLGQDATRALGSAIGGGGLPDGNAGPASSALPTSLINSESGGNWSAQNTAVGAGGQVGHFGRAQFGQARLQEAIAAGALPAGTTPQAFMASPELQKSAENWHFGDIDQSIKANGFDQLVGKAAIGGVPVTVEGLRAVAHLGGKDGMRKFVETNGAYNPADRNGTRLSDYFAQHAGSPRQTAQADMPAPGASPVQANGGVEGYFIPPGQSDLPAMQPNGVFPNFDAATGRWLGPNGGQPQAAQAPTPAAPAEQAPSSQPGTLDVNQPLAPVFTAEGVSQPWMGSALSRIGQPQQQQAAARPAPMPPSRPYDLAADLPAPGAVPAIGQAPQQVQPDYTSAEDGGSRAFAISQGRNAPTNPLAGIFQPAQPAQAALPPRAATAQTQNPADLPAPGAVPTQGQAATPVLSADLPRPTNREEMRTYGETRSMEMARGQAGKLAAALANSNLPANARAVGEIFLKEALERSKAPDSVKEFVYAKGMGWTDAKSPAEYAAEKERAKKNDAAENVEDRKAAAAKAGLKPGDVGYQGFILTGKMPREDSGPLSSTDKKAIMEADDMVLSNQNVIDNLRQAKELSAKAYAGPLAGVRGQAMGLVGSEAGQATTEYNNLVTTNALAQLKSTFGAAPTEGERKILLEIQGSANLPHDLRVKILDRGIALAERRLSFNQQRASELRGGDYYKSPDKKAQAGAPAESPAAPQPQQGQQRQAAQFPAAAIDFLKSNPDARDQFDAKYGQGAAASILGR